MILETMKIMGSRDIKVTATCVRIPVAVGHSEAVNIETEKKITRERAQELLRNAPSVIVITSYSIHYTKLYDYSYSNECSGLSGTFLCTLLLCYFDRNSACCACSICRSRYGQRSVITSYSIHYTKLYDGKF